MNLTPILKPIDEAVARVIVPHTRKVTAANTASLKSMLAPGMAICSRIDWSLSNGIIPGHFKHSCMVVDGSTIIQATGATGVATMPIDQFLDDKDQVIVMEPLFADQSRRQTAVQWAVAQTGDPYCWDFGLQDNTDILGQTQYRSFYCSLLVWASYHVTMDGILPFNLRRTYGIDTVTPQDLVAATTKWRYVTAAP